MKMESIYTNIIGFGLRKELLICMNPKSWGYVYFSSKAAGTDTFTIPQDENIKWEMYKLLRKAKKHIIKNIKLGLLL